MKDSKKKVKTAAHKDVKQDKALFGKMMKKEVPNMVKKVCK